MKKISLILSFIIVSFISLFAVDVDEQELKKNAENKTIEFINYTGTHENVDTVEAIKGIGRSLAVAVKTGRAGDKNKYYIIHAVDSSVKKGLDADIIILGKSANVDHIDNLRLIISSYLSAAYNYSEKDAKTIAHFVTIYNAVYRRDIKTFKERYKEIVLNNLTADSAGLDVRYTEWAGKTQIVIPLSDAKYAGTISTVDTSAISDKTVVEKMREKDDKDIEVRKEMVDIKERESEAAEDRSKKAKAEADAKQKEAERLKKEAEEREKQAKAKEQEALIKQKEAEAKKKAAEEANKKAQQDEKAKKEALEKQKEAEKAKKEAEAAKQDADKAKEEASKTKEEAESKQQEAEDTKKEAEEEKQMAEEKEDEAQSDRKNIAADTQKIIEEKKAEKKAENDAAVASALPGYGLKVIDEQNLYSELVLLDLRTAKEIKTSPVDTIRGRSIFEADGNLLAIAGSSSGNGIICLVLINPRTLEIIKQGDENISGSSVLIKDGENYYAIIDSNGKYYVGRFNSKLEVQAKSAIPVSAYTPITIIENGLLIQDSSNTIRLLNKSDLTDAVKYKEPLSARDQL